MKRREFVGLIGAAAAMWPLFAQAQQAGRPRRIAALWPFNATDPDGQSALAALHAGLRELGWGDIAIESRWGGGNIERTRGYAAELVGLSPDVIFACRVPAATSPGSRFTNRRSRASGSAFSRKSHRDWRGSRS
jgi:putative ABC transport system substrate-binding protein